ncbi:hypothetical protein VPH35_031293 [Triticum aestivum]
MSARHAKCSPHLPLRISADISSVTTFPRWFRCMPRRALLNQKKSGGTPCSVLSPCPTDLFFFPRRLQHWDATAVPEPSLDAAPAGSKPLPVLPSAEQQGWSREPRTMLVGQQWLTVTSGGCAGYGIYGRSSGCTVHVHLWLVDWAL